MAQLQRTRRSTDTQKTPTAQTSPTFEQLLIVDEAYWSPTTSPRSVMNHGHQEESTSPPQNRKSVIAKVKERAKKLRHSLSGRKNINENELIDDNTTPLYGLDLDDHNDDRPVEDPEYLGAPMYESEAAPESLRENARQHPRAVPVVSESHRFPIRTKPPEVLPVTETIHTITSKISGLSVSQETENGEMGRIGNREKTGNPSPQKWDKGVSVKEYFMNKLEPGEDDRALSRAITDAISPKKVTNNTGVVEKVKEAVSSFFWDEELSNSAARPANLTHSANSHSSRLYHSGAASSAPRLPVSSNARPVFAEEENHGKILQTN